MRHTIGIKPHDDSKAKARDKTVGKELTLQIKFRIGCNIQLRVALQSTQNGDGPRDDG